MKTLKNLWRYSKFIAIMLSLTTVGWAVLVGLLWWGLIFIGAGLSWILLMAAVTALVTLLLWVIWSGFAQEVN